MTLDLRKRDERLRVSAGVTAQRVELEDQRSVPDVTPHLRPPYRPSFLDEA